MANLTEISIGVRKTSLFLAFLAVVFIILRFITGFIINYYLALNKPPPAPPDVRFGKLPKPVYPKTGISSSGLNFTLATVEGTPPQASSSAKVYLMPKKSYTFESGEEAKKLAKRFDFEEEQPVVDSVYYYYKSAKDPNLTLFIDSVHLNFQLRYNYTENQSILNLGQIASKEEAIENVQNYLEYTNLIDNSILKGKVTTEPLTYDDRLKKMVTATSLSAAHAVKIHYFRNDLEGMPVLPDEYDKSYNYAIYAKTLGVQLENVLEISYTFWPIAENEYGTYPLISGEKAYEALVSGKAEVIKKGNNSNLVNIRKIYLAYYDSSTPQLYLQPIFVFEGDNDFVAYYQAVAPEYTE